jgi:hypothetical protein
MCESEIEQIDRGSERAKRIIAEVIQTITYKPGYTFTWDQCDDGRFLFYLHTPAIQDAKHVDRKFTIRRFEYFLIESCQTQADVRQCFIDLILGWEKHELYEWLKFDGKQFKDPHIEEL